MTATTTMGAEKNPPQPSMRQIVHDAVEEALAVLEARDLVYFDVGATQWVCNIPPKTSIRTCFGEVKMMVMRSTDGVLICMASSGGAAYLTSANVGIDATGCLVESSLLLSSTKQPTSDLSDPYDSTNGHAEDIAQEAAVGTTKHQPRQVDLRGCYLEHKDMMRVSRGLAGNVFVTVLSLSGNQLQDSTISLLSDALLHNGVLRELNLSYNEISALGSTLLATALADHSSLTLLDLMHNRIGRDGILPWLGRTLRNNRTLQELRLTHNDIGDRKGSELVTALASKPKTEEEQMKTAIARRRTVATAAPTAAIAAYSPPSFIASGVRGNGRGDEPFNKTLTVLQLGNTGISDDAAHHLRHVLAENCVLTHLDLSSNAFTDAGHDSIALGLAGNHALKYLNYNENRVDDEMAGLALVRALRQHPTLETALFQDCVRGSTVAVAVAEWLRVTKTLTTLDLSHCMLEPPGVVDFYRAVGQNTTLLNLEMTCMGIKSDQAVTILSKAVETHTALRFLNLSYNEITLRGCKMLREAAAPHGARLMMSLEGNSGEKKHPGVQISGGSRPARPPILNTI